MNMRTDQIAELEIMLDDYGVERVLDTLADCLTRKANWQRGIRYAYAKGRPATWLALEDQAYAIRALASKQVITGRTALESSDVRD